MRDTIIENVIKRRMVVCRLCQRCEYKRDKLTGQQQGNLTLRQLIPSGVLHWSGAGGSFGSICHTHRRHRIAGGTG